MSALHPALRARLEAASYDTLHKWQHAPDRYSVAYGVCEDAEKPLYLDVTLFNINGTNCCFRIAIDLKEVLEVFPWSEPSRAPAQPRVVATRSPSLAGWVDMEGDEL